MTKPIHGAVNHSSAVWREVTEAHSGHHTALLRDLGQNRPGFVPKPGRLCCPWSSLGLLTLICKMNIRTQISSGKNSHHAHAWHVGVCVNVSCSVVFDSLQCHGL